MDNVITTLCLLATVQGNALEPQVLRLGSEEFRERETAHRIIQKQLEVPWAEVTAKMLPRFSTDLETDCRVRVLTQKWTNALTDYGKYPWICALPKGYPDRERIVKEYLTKARETRGTIDGLDYFNHRYATYLYLRDLQAKGAWISQIHTIQREMVPNELYWYEHQKYP